MKNNIFIFYYKKNNQIKKTKKVEKIINLLWALDDDISLISDKDIHDLNLESNYIDNFKKKISRYDDKIPLYSIYFNHVYLIHRDNVYQRILSENYRTLNKKFYQKLLHKQNKSDSDLENLKLLNYYDFAILKLTYYKVFYKSFEIAESITTCRRPSFSSMMDHISPYYTKNELYYLAYDWNLISDFKLDATEIDKICNDISKYDLPSETLLKHQLYIYHSNSIGLVKYYSLSGSYFMNLYLRKYDCCNNVSQNRKSLQTIIRNSELENKIILMSNIILNAPPFEKGHTVYRFVNEDYYFGDIKIGDVYQDNSFMSTTRNPFYYKENYQFGYILIKIKLPPNIRGVGLCIESYSNFPKEEEIILPPGSLYKLISITQTKTNTNFHNIFNLNVTKKYEFEWIGNVNDKNKTDLTKLYFSENIFTIPDIISFDPLKEINNKHLYQMKISERLKYFRKNILNVNNQFDTTIADNKYIFSVEAYNSSLVYKPFFYIETENGIMLYTSNNKFGNINLIMEIDYNIHINYYFKYSVTEVNTDSIIINLDTKEWLLWLTSFCVTVGSRNIVIHSNYILNYEIDGNKIKSENIIDDNHIKTRYTYSQSIYDYLKYKKKYFDYEGVVTNFSYDILDNFFEITLDKIFNPSDKNELFRLNKIIKSDNLGDFYINIIEKYPRYTKQIEDNIAEYFEDNNPLSDISYTIDGWAYLYNLNMMDIIPSDNNFVKKGTFKKIIGNNKIPKFKNRLRYLTKM